MRSILIAILMFFCSLTSAVAGVSVSIGLSVPVYPQLVPVPGYPVYYAPGLNSNYFFYDGMYWVFVNDNWYASTWYNGPWEVVAPDYVPLFILRVPVRYYRYPPVYFRAWYANAPPRWGEHWGSTWEEHHRGWNTWNRAAVPAPAPLPVYQRQYSGTRYPAVEQQYALQTQNYRYRPRDAVVQQHYQASSRVQGAPASVQQSSVTPAPSQPSQAQRREVQRSTSTPSHQAAVPPPRAQPPQVERSQRPASVPPQAAAPSPRGQPPQHIERVEPQRTASAPTAMQQPPAPQRHEQAPQQKGQQSKAAPSPRGQPPQHIERVEPQRTASAPIAMQQSPVPQRQEQAPQQKGQQGKGPPPARGPNQEREGATHGG